MSSVSEHVMDIRGPELLTQFLKNESFILSDSLQNQITSMLLTASGFSDTETADLLQCLSYSYNRDSLKPEVAAIL